MVRSLKAHIGMVHPEVIFLCETKASEERMLKVIKSLVFSDHLIFGAKGRSGDICMMWSNALKIKMLGFNSN